MIYSIFIGFFAAMSAAAFLTMRHDKLAARAGKRRIPERTLWKLAVYGGGIGAYLGMVAFRHKTKHMSFRIGFTLLAIAHVALIIWATPYFSELP